MSQIAFVHATMALFILPYKNTFQYLLSSNLLSISLSPSTTIVFNKRFLPPKFFSHVLLQSSYRINHLSLSLSILKAAMSAFITLPHDLVTAIFEYLEHIDDALNLANTCQRFKNFLSDTETRGRVIKGIFYAHSHHNDIQLCRLLNSTPYPRPEHGTNVKSFLSYYNIYVDWLTDQEILAIIRLRQQIRSIQNLYLSQSVQNQYRRSNFPAGRSEYSDIVECKFQETLTTEGDPKSYFSANRFSDAVVAYWVLIEARKMVISIHDQSRDPGFRGRYDSILRSFWCGSGHRTLLQSLDILEVHDFIYGFLIRKMYYRAWEEGGDETAPVDEAWALKLQHVSLGINPLDAAQLGSVEGDLFDPTLWQSLPKNYGSFYLRFDEIPTAMKRFGIETLSLGNILEFNLGVDIYRLGSVESWRWGRPFYHVEAWESFRRKWPTTARGSLLWSLKSSEDFLDLLFHSTIKIGPGFIFSGTEPAPESPPASNPLDDDDDDAAPKSPSSSNPLDDPFPLSLSRKALFEYSHWLDLTAPDRADEEG